jgi:hypothetical protein
LVSYSGKIKHGGVLAKQESGRCLTKEIRIRKPKQAWQRQVPIEEEQMKDLN